MYKFSEKEKYAEQSAKEVAEAMAANMAANMADPNFLDKRELRLDEARREVLAKKKFRDINKGE